MLAYVILQISSSIVPQSNLNDYLDHVRRNEIPSYAAAPGLVSVWLLQRSFVAYVEVMTVSSWWSREAMQKFAENLRFCANAGTEYGSIQLDPRTYEVVVSCDGEHREE